MDVVAYLVFGDDIPPHIKLSLSSLMGMKSKQKNNDSTEHELYTPKRANQMDCLVIKVEL